MGRAPGHARPGPVRLFVVNLNIRGPVTGRARKRPPIACADAQESISAGLDGERPPLSRPVLEAHLATCEVCRYFGTNVTGIGRSARVRSTVPVPEGLVASLLPLVEPTPRRAWVRLRAGRRREGRRSTWARTAQWAGAMAPAIAAAVALPLGVWTHPHLVPDRPPSTCTVGLAARHRPSGA
jgi:predicted anti-sigma-YlaC factor YlaD